MRINKFVALATGLSRRKADELIAHGEVTVNGQPPSSGQDVGATDVVRLGQRHIEAPMSTTTIMFNKPVGYVVSRDGQGSRTIYDLLPPEYHNLKPIGRLDKNSSGLLLLTNDGNLANELTHPSKQKTKVYEVTLYKPLTETDRQKIEQGVELEDGLSKLVVIPTAAEEPRGNQTGSLPTARSTSDSARDDTKWIIKMHEGRNRQIRRTFAALNYEVKTLHRTRLGKYTLNDLSPGGIVQITQ